MEHYKKTKSVLFFQTSVKVEPRLTVGQTPSAGFNGRFCTNIG